MRTTTHLPQLTPTQWALVGILALIQYGLMIWALVRLLRTDQRRLTLPLVAWLLIILLVNGIGAIAFLAAGRKPAPVPEPAPRPAGESATAHAVAVLYGTGRHQAGADRE